MRRGVLVGHASFCCDCVKNRVKNSLPLRAIRVAVEVPATPGTWKELTEDVNAIASNFTGQGRNTADATIDTVG